MTSARLKNGMTSFLSAIQFLTALPVAQTVYFDAVGMRPFFPVVGLLIGVLLASFDMVAARFWSGPVAALLDVIFLVFITGALHLDGVADTADGLYGRRPRERALEIMKDSRVGAMGLVAVCCLLGAKWGGIHELSGDRFLLLTIIPAYARGGMLFGISALPYGRREEGTGHPFFTAPLTKADFLGMSIPAGLSLLLGWKGLWLNGCFVVFTAGMLLFYKKRMGCITGDMLGALTECGEAVLFLLVAVIR